MGNRTLLGDSSVDIVAMEKAALAIKEQGRTALLAALNGRQLAVTISSGAMAFSSVTVVLSAPRLRGVGRGGG